MESNTYRVTLGERLGVKKTKWHHLVVSAADLNNAVSTAEQLLCSTAEYEMHPLRFLVLRFHEGTMDKVWKWSIRDEEYFEYPLADFLADQVEFKRRSAEARDQRIKESERANESMGRMWDQFVMITDTVRSFLSGATDRDELARVVDEITFV